MAELSFGVKIWGEISQFLKALNQGKDGMKDFEKGAVSSFKGLSDQVKAAEMKFKNLAATMGINSPEARQALAGLTAIKEKYADINKAAASAGKNEGMFSGIKGEILGLGAGLASFATAMEVAKSAIATSDALTDKWEETVASATEGYNAFLRTIVTGDWSNFLTNINTAIKAGKDYAATLDEIHERTNALNIVEAEKRTKINDLMMVMKDQRKTDKERADAAAQALKLENELMQSKSKLAKTNLDNELMLASAQSGLSKASVAQYLKNRDQNNELIKQSNEYLDAINNLDEAKKRVSKSGGQDKSAIEDVTKFQNVIASTSATIRIYATDIVDKMGRVTPEQMDKASAAYANLFTVQNDFKEGTRRTWSTYTGLLKTAGDETSRFAKQANSDLKDLNEAIDKWMSFPHGAAGGDISRMTPKASKGVSIPGMPSGLATAKDNGFSAISSIDPRTVTQKWTDAISSIQGALGGLSGSLQSVFAGLSEFLKQNATGFKEGWVKAAGAIGTAVQGVVGFITELFTQQSNRRLSELDAQTEKEREAIQNSRMSEEGKAKALDALDKQSAKKRKELLRQQAKDQKTAALMQAIVTGALAVVQAFSIPVIGVAMGVIMSALVAAQIATIIAQPLPALASGGLAYAPTMALVGDNPNARIDPEVIAPLSKLRGMLGGGEGGQLVAVVSGENLKFVLDRANRNGMRRYGS